MKIIVYDPLYSSMGHFFRYNKYILTLLSDNPSIREIIYISNEGEGASFDKISSKIKSMSIPGIKSAQILSFQSYGFGKIKLYINMLWGYSRVIKYINESRCDLCFFTSNGMLPFWLAVNLKLRKKYIVSVISLKWLYDKYSGKHLLFLAYRYFLRHTIRALVTEECYIGALVSRQVRHVSVLHDRFLHKIEPISSYGVNISADNRTKLITLGTLSHRKNPLEFVKLLRSISERERTRLRYDIYGKSLDDTGELLRSLINNDSIINYHDQYIGDDEYERLMLHADFIVIPYDGSYTKFMTSGVMWDCFEYQKPIICPDVEPFRHYISTYNIGFIYTPDTLGSIIRKLHQNKDKIGEMMRQNYKKLYEIQSYQNTSERFVSLVVESTR